MEYRNDESPGFRFYPREEELISFYLHNKLEGRRPEIDRVIPVVNIYDHHPSDLPQLAGERCQGDLEQWFFFIPMQHAEARGGRPNRLTNEGYWKATGSPAYVFSSEGRIIGVRRTMVFYEGRARNGEKTPWKMNEYRAIEGQVSLSTPPSLRQGMSLCRVYNGLKSVRAFDRRPPHGGAAAGVEETVIGRHHHHHDNQLATTSQHHNLSSLPERACPSSISSSSSSSGENVGPPPKPPLPPSQEILETERYGNLDFGNEALWDWSQLNWFD